MKDREKRRKPRTVPRTIRCSLPVEGTSTTDAYHTPSKGLGWVRYASGARPSSAPMDILPCGSDSLSSRRSRRLVRLSPCPSDMVVDLESERVSSPGHSSDEGSIVGHIKDRKGKGWEPPERCSPPEHPHHQPHPGSSGDPKVPPPSGEADPRAPPAHPHPLPPGNRDGDDDPDEEDEEYEEDEEDEEYEEDEEDEEEEAPRDTLVGDATEIWMKRRKRHGTPWSVTRPRSGSGFTSSTGESPSWRGWQISGWPRRSGTTTCACCGPEAFCGATSARRGVRHPGSQPWPL